MINETIWRKKYKSDGENTPSDTFQRVARGVADTSEVEEAIFQEMNELRFIFGGRVMAFGGTDKPKATLGNCYAMPSIPDSMDGIMRILHEAALTMQAGGGVGFNFPNLRPAGSPVGGTGSRASGPVSFMHVYNATSRTIDGAGQRKGAMISIMNVSHPDFFKFVSSKEENTKAHPVLERFNISVGISDAFMKAVEENKEWEFAFEGKSHGTARAREMFRKIVESNHKKAEPGTIFLDTINRQNNLFYCETLDTCNPCGEQPLAPYGVCNLGAITLPMFIKYPFTTKASFDFEKFGAVIRLAVRCLDNIVDKNYYPLQQQRDEALAKRRIGLGPMGLGSALAMLRIRYGSPESLASVERIMEFLRNTAYSASADLAAEKGAFPLFDERYLEGEFVKQLPEDLKEKIRKNGIRNSHILTIAPTGSISQLVGFVSGGVEPIYDIEYNRRNYNETFTTPDYAWKLYCEMFGNVTEVPDYFVTAHNLTPDEHIAVQSVCQKYVDASISKTINVHKDITVEELEDVYMKAWKAGLKGCTIYRDKSLEDEILSTTDEKPVVVTPVHVHKKKERDYYLDGGTYKVRIPDKLHAFYCSFTQDEDGKPMEFFVQTKDQGVREWTDAIGCLTSAVLRSVDDPTFLIEEFKQVHGDTGFWSGKRHKHVPSLIAEFGHVMEDHFIKIGVIDPEVPVEAYAEEVDNPTNGNNGDAPKLSRCPRCGQRSGRHEGGCFVCHNPSCLFDKCGS